ERLKTEAEQAVKAASAAKSEVDGLKKQLAAAGGAGDVKAKLDAAEKKAEAAQLAAANLQKMADAARVEANGLKEKLSAADKNTQAAEAKLKTARNNVQRLNADKKQVDALLKKITDDLVAAKFLDPKADRTALAQGVQDALKTASTVDAGGRLREMQAEVNRAKEQLDQRWQPTEMLAVWLPVLNNRGNRALATKAIADANRVLSDDKATAGQKAQAQAVLGLALRNQEKFAEAKAALEKAKAGLKG